MDLGAARAAALFQEVGLTGPLERLALGESNEVWAGDSDVLRIAATPGGDSLLREAALVQRLPAAVGYPDVRAVGVRDGYDWMITERLPGQNLGQLWPTMPTPTRVAAMTDLLRRIDHVHRTAVDGLPGMPPTPLYALDRGGAAAQLEVAKTALGRPELERLRVVLDEGSAAVAGVPRVVVHTDVGWHNAVWDGRRAVPVDFEFSCLGPADLDLERIGRDVMLGGDHGVAAAFVAQVARLLTTDRWLLTRLRSYAVLWELWALTKWVANDPARIGIASWGPVRDLKAHCLGTSWVDQLEAHL